MMKNIRDAHIYRIYSRRVVKHNVKRRISIRSGTAIPADESVFNLYEPIYSMMINVPVATSYLGRLGVGILSTRSGRALFRLSATFTKWIQIVL